MARIFLALSLFAILLLVANLLIGLTMGDFGAASRQYQSAHHNYEQVFVSASTSEAVQQAAFEKQQASRVLGKQHSRFWPHIWLGVIAALMTLLVNSISITYFIGTNRWSLEVVEAFSLDQKLSQRSQQLKRKTFPWSLIAILLILVISALGAASDPSAALGPDAADWVECHWILAMIGSIVIAVCLFKQVSAIGANFELINEIMAAAERQRERRKQAREAAEQAGAMNVEN